MSKHSGEGERASDPARAKGGPQRSLRGRALSGSAWTLLGFGTTQVIRLGSSLILTRLLFPEAFGLMALVNVFLLGLASFSDLGLGQSIIQSPKGDDRDFLDTAWTLQVARGTTLFVMACALAWPAALFYDQPQLRELLPAAGLTALIAGFNSTALPRLQRHLDIARFTAIPVAGHACSVAVMIAWVAVYPTVWALVGGAIAAALVVLALSRVVTKDPPNRFHWDREAAGQLIRFGKWIFLSTLLAFFAGQSDRLIFGKLASLEMLGVYSIALIFAMIPTQITNQIGGSVVFPAFSRTHESGSSLAATYRRVRLSVFALCGFVVAGLVGGARPLIEVLYDPRYADAGWILQWLAIAAWLQILEVPSGSALLATGRPKWLALSNALKLIGIALLTPVGYWLGGFAGAIQGFVAAEALRYGACMIGARRLGLATLRFDLAVTLWLAIAGCAGVISADALGVDAPATRRLAVGVVVACAIWLPAAVWSLRTEGELLPAAFRQLRERGWLGPERP